MSLWMLAQIATAQMVPNSSFNATAPTVIPNTQSFPQWAMIEGADVAQDGVEIDCADILDHPSNNGGQFLRATSDGKVHQGASTTVTGLTIGVAYKIRFEAGLVRHYGQSSGHWTVTFALVPIDAPDITLPAGNPEQTMWTVQEVGPFPAVAASHTLEFLAHTNADGNTISPDLPLKGECDYDSIEGVADLLLDAVVMIPDTDGDGLFDDDEAALGTDPLVPDTDGDGLLDFEEVDTYHTDPLDYDTDDDGAIDGIEAVIGSDPHVTDSDGDGLLDGDEVGRGTSPILDDTDGDGFDDGAEVAASTDPLDAKSFPKEPTTPTGPTDTGTEPGTTADTADTGGKGGDDADCGCASTPTPAGLWLGAALVGLASARRRRVA